MAAAAITPRLSDTRCRPASFPGVSFISPPHDCMFGMIAGPKRTAIDCNMPVFMRAARLVVVMPGSAWLGESRLGESRTNRQGTANSAIPEPERGRTPRHRGPLAILNSYASPQEYCRNRQGHEHHLQGDVSAHDCGKLSRRPRAAAGRALPGTLSRCARSAT